MNVFENDLLLPGVFTHIENDYSFDYDQSAFGTTDSLAIIGTAFNGPVGVPTPVYSPVHAAYIFGQPYDSKTHREASLVANIQDAWDRGCRTIYAVRIGGIELAKTFDFCIDTKYKLQVSSLFPTNEGKQCYFTYTNQRGAEEITFYKPADRATIAEKRRGAVSATNAVLQTTLRLNQDYALTCDDRLVDLINLFNNHIFNNVLKLTIIDENGSDVTTSPEVYDLPIGALFPGVYFIGRDRSLCEERTELDFVVTSNVKNITALPFENITHTHYRVLRLNTDVSQPYPIYADATNADLFNKFLSEVKISLNKGYKFLETAGIADRAFALDKKDYEETSLSSFEIYKRLGNGFAITARAERRLGSDGQEAMPRVAETPTSDVNRVVPIIDGVYSTLQDAEIKYRALVCANADDKIDGRLPRPSEFRKTTPKEIPLLDGAIVLTAKVDEKDYTLPKKYTFTLEKKDHTSIATYDDILTDTVMPIVAAVEEDEDALKARIDAGELESGKLLLNTTTGKLYRTAYNGLKKLNNQGYLDRLYIVGEDIYKGVEDAEATGEANDGKKRVKFEKDAELTGETYKEKKYVLGETLDSMFIFEIKEGKLSPVGDFGSVFNEEDEDNSFVTYAESLYNKENRVIIKSSLFHNITVGELVELINNHDVLSRLFTAAVTEKGSEVHTSFVSDVLDFSEEAVKKVGTTEVTEGPEEKKTTGDRATGYDYAMYIPYRTTDNFARHLAQHCKYTELKTIPAFGFIGASRLINTSLASIARRVNELAAFNFDMYAKTNAGRNMLDARNLPYNIGEKVSITAFQYPVTTGDAKYTYISTGAAGYAGMVSTLPIDQSSTSQTFPINEMQYTYSQSQLSQLTTAGIVTARRSFTKGLVITDGVTMAPSDSVFRRLSISRVMGSVEDLIRRACEPFIGKLNTPAARNSLTTAIRSNLDKIVGTLIQEYDFKVVNDRSLEKFGYIDINYEIVPYYEIRQIRNNIRVSDTITQRT